jgi:hypothetical protein
MYLEVHNGGRIVMVIFVFFSFHSYVDYIAMLISITPYRKRLVEIFLPKKKNVCKFWVRIFIPLYCLARVQTSINNAASTRSNTIVEIK